MKFKNMIDYDLGGLYGGREFSERNEMCRFRKTVNDGKDDSVTCRSGKSGDKIEGNMGPRTSENGQGSKQTSRG